MNKVFLEGRLTHDPKKTKSGETDIAEFSLAVNPNGDKEASFFDLVAFGGWARNFAARRGDAVVVEGHLRQERWTDKGGAARSRVRIICDTVKELKGAPKEASASKKGS